MLESLARKIRGGGHPATARFTLPPVVFEIAPGFVSGTGLDGSMRKGRKVARMALQSLGPTALDPHLSHSNITGAEEFSRAAENLMAAVGNGDGRIGLVLPDGAVRVALLAFEALPDSAEEAESLIRWRMRDKLPFNSDEARATYQVLSSAPGHVEILALAMRNLVIEEYEAAFAALNAKATLILPAAVALLPLLPESASGAQVLIHVCGNWLTVAVLDGPVPCAWRTRELDPLDTLHYEREIATECARVAASAGETTRIEVGRVWLCARPPAETSLAAAIAETMGREVSLVRPPAELSSLLGASDREQFEQFGAPVAGLVANEK